MIKDFERWGSSMDFKRDRFGFVDLTRGFSIGCRDHSLDVYNHYGKLYYFKELQGCRASGLFRNYALDNPYILAEVVNGRFYKDFGMQSVEYYPARQGNTKGVISRSYTDEYGSKYAQTLREYLNREAFEYPTHKSLKDLGEYEVIRKTKKSFKEQLQMASLLHLGTGQYDGHVANMAVKLDEDQIATDLILFDNNLCMPAIETYSDLKEIYGRQHNIFNKLGISKSNQNLEDYYKELVYTDLISTDVIKTYLANLDYQLRDNRFFVDVKAEVKEETGAKLDNNYLDKLKLVLNATGERVELAYQERISVMGE